MANTLADVERRIRIVRARISRSRGQAKRAEQYGILNGLLDLADSIRQEQAEALLEELLA